LLPELALALAGLLFGLPVPLAFNADLTARQADAAGCG
jgi:hypothetical protein